MREPDRITPQRDLKRELAIVISHQARLIDELRENENTRNQEEHRRLIESTNAFKAVLSRLNGGPSLLHCIPDHHREVDRI